MSVSRLRRKSTSRRSSRRRRRRKSTVSELSWHSARSDFFGDEEDEEMIRRFADDDDDNDNDRRGNDDDDDDGDEDEDDDGDDDRPRGRPRRYSSRRGNRRSRKSNKSNKSNKSDRSNRSGSENERAKRKRNKDGKGGGDEEEDEDEYMTEEMMMAKINRCKELIESVKHQTWKMSKKMKVLKKARAYVETFEGKLSRSKGYQQRWKQLYKQIERLWINSVAALLPWEMRIKTIESHFGSVVASYFIFLRWLIWISVWLAVLPLCFIILPELIEGEDHGSSVRKRIPDKMEKTSHDLKTIWDAEGVVKYSLMFYGYYGNTQTLGQDYRLPLAYLMTSLAAFAYSFVVVLKTMANNSRQSRLSTTDDEFTFSWKLFTDWDFMIENHETATTKRASIITTFKESILEEQEKVREGNQYLLLVLRVLANFIILILLALSTYIIQLFVERSREMELKKRQDPDYEAGFWAENELTVIMTLISTLFPNILDLVSLMEKYHPRTSLRLMLARIFVLNLLNLYTLFIALYNKQNDLLESFNQARQNGTYVINATCTSVTPSTSIDAIMPTPSLDLSTFASSLLPSLDNASSSDIMSTEASNMTSSTNTLSMANVCTNYTADTMTQTLENDLCWETMIGQETFKLTVMDTVFVLGQIVIIDVIRSHFIKHCNALCCWDMEKTFPEYPDFKTAENLLHLISNQGTIWLGAFFAPGLPLLNLLKLIIMLYVRCWTVMTYNAPQQRIFRASRSSNFYYALLLVMLFLCMLPPLFAIVAIDPSPNCGPFSGQSKIYHILTMTMDSELPDNVNTVIEYLASPGVILPVFMLLGMVIYYLVAVGKSLREANRQLTMQLEYERTEGRRKVYAMADAKHDKQQRSGVKGWQQAKVKVLSKQRQMAEAAASILSEMKAQREGGQPADGVAGRTRAKSAATERVQAVVRKQMAAKLLQTSDRSQAPLIPVAIVKGKQSLKVNPAGSRDRAKQRLRSAFKYSTPNQTRDKDDDVMDDRSQRNSRAVSRRRTKVGRGRSIEERIEEKPRRRQDGRDEELEEEVEEMEKEEDEDEEAIINEEGGEYEDYKYDDDDDDSEEAKAVDGNVDHSRRTPAGKRARKGDNHRARERPKLQPQKTRKQTPQPPPAPPLPSQVPSIPRSQTASSRSQRTISQSTKVDESTGGSILDRIKMFQQNSGTSDGDETKHDNKNNVSRNFEKKQDTGHSGEGTSESAGVKAYRRNNEVLSSTNRPPSEAVRKPKPQRGISDSKGHLIPYDDVEGDDTESDDGSDDSDDVDPDGEDVSSSNSEKGKKLNISKNVEKRGKMVALAKKTKKENTSRTTQKPTESGIKADVDSAMSQKSWKKSKTKNLHHHVVEAQIEIVNENKTKGRRKLGSMKGQRAAIQRKARESNETSAGPLPSIKIEDFSDKSVDKADSSQDIDTTDPKTNAEGSKRNIWPNTGPYTRPNTGTNTGPNTVPNIGPNTEQNTGPNTGPNPGPNPGPTAGPSHEHLRTNFNRTEGNPASSSFHQGQKKKAVPSKDKSVGHFKRPEAVPVKDNLTRIMKSKGKLAKWRRVAFGLRRKDKRDVKATGQIDVNSGNETESHRVTVEDSASGVVDTARKEKAKSSGNRQRLERLKAGILLEPSDWHRKTAMRTTEDDLRSQHHEGEGRIPDAEYYASVENWPNRTNSSTLESPLVDYYSEDESLGISDNEQRALARRRKSFLHKRASLASIRSDRPSAAVSDDDDDDDDGEMEPWGNVPSGRRRRVEPQERQLMHHTNRNPTTEVIGQTRDGNVIVGLTNARLEIGSGEE